MRGWIHTRLPRDWRWRTPPSRSSLSAIRCVREIWTGKWGIRNQSCAWNVDCPEANWISGRALMALGGSSWNFKNYPCKFSLLSPASKSGFTFNVYGVVPEIVATALAFVTEHHILCPPVMMVDSSSLIG